MKTSKELHAEAAALKAQAIQVEQTEKLDVLQKMLSKISANLSKLSPNALYSVGTRIVLLDGEVLRGTAGRPALTGPPDRGELYESDYLGNGKYFGQYNG